MSAIHVHPETKHRLSELSQATGKTPADIIQEALDHYLENRQGSGERDKEAPGSPEPDQGSGREDS